jgi:hypothetical protein
LKAQGSSEEQQLSEEYARLHAFRSTLHVQKETAFSCSSGNFLALLCTPVPAPGGLSKMEDLAAAAAMASQERDSGDAQQPAKEPVSGKKRGRGTKIEAAEKKLLELVSKRAIAAAKVEQLQALESKKKRDEEAIKRVPRTSARASTPPSRPRGMAWSS